MLSRFSLLCSLLRLVVVAICCFCRSLLVCSWVGFVVFGGHWVRSAGWVRRHRRDQPLACLPHSLAYLFADLFFAILLWAGARIF